MLPPFFPRAPRARFMGRMPRFMPFGCFMRHRRASFSCRVLPSRRPSHAPWRISLAVRQISRRPRRHITFAEQIYHSSLPPSPLVTPPSSEGGTGGSEAARSFGRGRRLDASPFHHDHTKPKSRTPSRISCFLYALVYILCDIIRGRCGRQRSNFRRSF